MSNHAASLILNAIIIMATRLGYIITVNSNNEQPLTRSDDILSIIAVCGAYKKITLFFDEKHRHGRYNGDGYRYDMVAVVHLDLEKGVDCIVRASNQYEESAEENYVGEILIDARSVQRYLSAIV